MGSVAEKGAGPHSTVCSIQTPTLELWRRASGLPTTRLRQNGVDAVLGGGGLRALRFRLDFSKTDGL